VRRPITNLSRRTLENPSRNSKVPCPVPRLVIHTLPPNSRFISSSDTALARRSDLFKRKQVSRLSRVCTVGGVCIVDLPDLMAKISGRDKTHREISEASTLRLVSPKKGRIYQRTHMFFALSIPIFSTKSSVALTPAVSATITGRPPISSESSRISRVVPGTGVTIAASLWARRCEPVFTVR